MLPRRALLAIGTALAVAAPPACSLLTTIPDLTSGAGAPDAALSADAARDAGDAGDAGDARFCASRDAMFCDDFDDEPAPTPRWDALGPNGAVAVDTAVARSAPASLLATLPSGGGTCDRATAQKRLAGSFRATHLALAVRVDAAGDLGPATAVAMQQLVVHVGDSSTACQAILVLDPAAPPSVYEQAITSFPDGGTSSEGASHPFPASLADGAWHAITVDVDWSTNRLTASADGVPQVNDPLTSACPAGFVPAELQVGLFCVNARPSAMRVRFDDLTFDAR